jgi:hypothetical protein
VRVGTLDGHLLSDVMGDLLPSAFAIALSAGSAFALGWIAGVLAVSVIVVLVLGAGSDPGSDDPGISWFKVASESSSS